MPPHTSSVAGPRLNEAGLKFQGYQIHTDADGAPYASLFLPGYAEASRVSVEIRDPSDLKKTSQWLSLKQDAKKQYWQTTGWDHVPLGSYYRIWVGHGSHMAPVKENLYVQKVDKAEFNVISKAEATAPRKNVVISDIFLDSLVTREKLQKLLEARGNAAAWRTQFNQYRGNDVDLNAIFDKLVESGFTAILLKPFTGGDNLSAHHYWTVDPYVLNNSFRSKDDFKALMLKCLQKDVKLFSDGAYVSQGLNGVQYWANVLHGLKSPFWNWFQFEKNMPQGRVAFPNRAYNKVNLGVLPTQAGDRGEINYNAFDVRLINDPTAPKYNPRKPTFVQLYDPRVEDADGKPKKFEGRIIDWRDSVQKYQFPVTANEAKAKQKALAGVTDPVARKKILIEWQHFNFVRPDQDNSGVKWDGQLDQIKMDMTNPQVRHYMATSMGYWTGLVRNIYLNHVGAALSQALTTIEADSDAAKWSDDAKLRRALEVITGDGQALPTPRHDFEQPEAILALYHQRYARPATTDHAVPQALAKTLLQQYPVMATPVPPLAKAAFSLPAFADVLTQNPLWLRAVDKVWNTVLAPVGWIPPFRHGVERLKIKSFEQMLGDKLEDALAIVNQALPPAQRQRVANLLKLRDVQAMVSDSVGEALFLQLLTGKSKLNAATLEDDFYNTVPTSITQASPAVAAQLYGHFLKQRLGKLDPKVLAEQLTAFQLQNWDPRAVGPALALLHQREFGLNWRIDAAKDVANIARIYNTSGKQARFEAFEQELGFARDFWKEATAPVRQLFPTSVVVGELTELDVVAKDSIATAHLRTKEQKDQYSTEASEMANKVQNGFLDDGQVLTSAVAWRYFYNKPARLVHDAPPQDMSDSQMLPNGFINDELKPMVQTAPWQAVRQAQNHTALHDSPNTMHVLLLNTELAKLDRMTYWGLADDWHNAIDELKTMAPFVGYKKALDERITTLKSVGIELKSPDADALLANLKVCLPNENDEKTIRQFSPDVQNYLFQSRKEHRNNGRYLTPANADTKAKFVQELFDKFITPEFLGVSLPTPGPGDSAEVKAQKQLQTQSIQNTLADFKGLVQWMIADRLQEPSQARAMRAVVSNALESLDLSKFKDFGKGPDSARISQESDKLLDRFLNDEMTEDAYRTADAALRSELTAFEAQKQAFPNKVKLALYDAMGKTIHQFGAHWGYQPLPVALDNLFKNVSEQDPNVAGVKDALKSDLYKAILTPAIEKMKRVIAIQVAVPGNPSVYLPDFYGMTGGELAKNAFLQDRHPLPYDDIDPEIANQVADLQQTASQLMRLRQLPHLQALNDGVVLNLPAYEGDDEPKNGKFSCVLPIARDNGQQQVLMFINTGNPKSLGDLYRKRFGDGGQYPHPVTQTPRIEGYKPDITDLHVKKDTVYYPVDLASGQVNTNLPYVARPFYDRMYLQTRDAKMFPIDTAAVFVRAPEREQPV
jgi:hypothetical protein